jgi:DNA-binding XRE family transcriptional regulator
MVGEDVRRLTGQAMLHQSELAAAVEMSPQALNAILQGRSEPSTATARKIAEYFAVSLDSLFETDPRRALKEALDNWDMAPARTKRSPKPVVVRMPTSGKATAARKARKRG